MITVEDTPKKRGLRPRRTGWNEPNRQPAPSMTAKAVADELGFSSVESVHILTRRGPEEDGLAGYIPASNGRGWVRKKGTGFSGVQLMYYEGDVREWKEQHPIIDYTEIGRERGEYTSDEKERVIAEAEKLLELEGKVTRTKVLINLAYEPETYNPKIRRGVARKEEGYGPTLWNSRTYKKVRQILDDAGYSLTDDIIKRTLKRRTYRAS